MKDYSHFHTFNYFIRVLKSCPKSALLYIQIWKNKGKYNNIIADKKDIRKDYLMSPTMFRNLLSPLAFLNLIQFVESGEKYQIEILGTKTNDL